MASRTWNGFVGGFYEALTPIMGAETAVNIYKETREDEGSPKRATIYGTPGLKFEATVATAGCRGWFTQDGQTWVVVGDVLYERTAVGTYASRGTIVDDGKPVCFASNGQGGDQLGIVGGSQLKVLDLTTDTLSAAVSLPFANPVTIVFQDGYGLINQANSPIFWFSAIEDLTSWDALDFVARSGTSDNIVALGQSIDRVRVFGTATTTLFYNSGDADTPWLPYPGTTVQMGLVSPWAMVVHEDHYIWVAQPPQGAARVVLAADARPTTISTPPIEAFLERCTTLADVEALVYAQEGHVFVAFTCPNSPDDVQTYVFDLRERLWHARAGWNAISAIFTRWRARGCTVAAQDVLVGDYQTGDLYTLDLTTLADNGETLVRERTAPYLSDDAQWLSLDQFELGTQPGVGITSGQGSDPQVELSISRDGAKTWVSAGLAPLGALGEYLTRTIWRRLGRARADRLVLRVRQSDPVQTTWTGAWLTISPGSGQL